MNVEVQEVLLLFETRHFSGIMTDSELDSGGRVAQLLTVAGDCCLQHVWTSSESHIASYSMGIKGFFLGVNSSWLEADPLPPSGAKVKNQWSYTSSPTYAFVVCTRTTYLLLLHIIVALTEPGDESGPKLTALLVLWGGTKIPTDTIVLWGSSRW